MSNLGWFTASDKLGVPDLWMPYETEPYFWLDGSDVDTLTLVSGKVSAWRDKRNNGLVATQSNDALRPTFDVRGFLSFDADYLEVASSQALFKFLHYGQSSIFAVNRFGVVANPLASYGMLGSNGTASSAVGVAFAYDDRAYSVCSDADYFSITAGGGTKVAVSYDGVNPYNSNYINVITPNTRVLTIREINTAAAVALRYKFSNCDNTDIAANTFTGTASSANASYNLQIGACGNAVFPFTGDFCELLIYNKILSLSDRQKVAGYLAHKWGLAKAA